MTGYWWQCEKCGDEVEFDKACGSTGIAHYIWDVMLKSSWDQSKLVLPCTKCGNISLRITYEFPRMKDRDIIRVLNVVGVELENKYLPMMWETYFNNDSSDRVYDFKYLNGRNIRGLMSPAVLSRENLKQLFDLYKLKTDSTIFP